MKTIRAPATPCHDQKKTMNESIPLPKLFTLLLTGSVLFSSNGLAADFSYDQQRLPGAKPWTGAEFQNNPDNF